MNLDVEEMPLKKINHCFHSACRKKYIMFIIIMTIGLLIFWISAFLSRGELLDNYFVYSKGASLMDFFSPIIKAIENTYVEPYYSKYPPMANLFFQLVRYMIPAEDLVNFQAIKASMYANIPMILMIILSILLLYEMMQKYVAGLGAKYSNKFIAWTILLSGPFLFCYERANIIILTFILVLFFIMNYENSNKLIREFALLSLALAASIKIYPALFGILLIKKGNMKVAIRTVIYGVATTFFPFIFYEGFNSFIQFFINITSSNVDLTLSNFPHCFSFPGFIFIMSRLIFANTLTVLPTWLLIVPLVLCGTIYFCGDEKWKKYLAITMLIIWLPTLNFTYTLCYLFIPLLEFFNTEQRKKIDWIYLFCFILIFLPYALPIVDSVPNKNYFLPMGTIITNCSMCVLVVVCCVETILNKTKRIKEKSL